MRRRLENRHLLSFVIVEARLTLRPMVDPLMIRIGIEIGIRVTGAGDVNEFDVAKRKKNFRVRGALFFQP